MSPEQEKVWEVLKKSAEEMRREFVLAEFNKMIEDKICKLSSNDADAAIYSSMVKSYYGTDEKGTK